MKNTPSFRPLDLETGGGHLHAFERKGQGDPVVLLHGAGPNALPWQQMTNLLVYTGATRVEIAGHHWLHHANREEVKTAIADWLGTLSS